MTRETKIGLLVGLAFIIVFAIILSEKGPSSRNSSLPAFSMVDRMGTDAASAAAGQPLANAGKLPVDRALPPIVQPAIGVNPDMAMREEEVAQGPRVGEEELPPLPDSVISLINGDIAPTEPTTDSVGADAMPAFTANVPRTNVSDSPVSSWSTPAEPTTGERVELAASQQPMVTVPAVEQSPKFKIRTEHTVDKGESLGKIAAKYYERSTPQRIDAIYAVNKDVLDNRHTVKVGQKLRIPDLGEAAKHFEPAPDFALSNLKSESDIQAQPRTKEAVRIPIPIGEKNQQATTQAPVMTAEALNPTIRVPQTADAAQRREAPRAYKVYEVRPSDTLSKIARRELGSEKFTRDLFELNKDVITNKNTIKPGMKLRLPVPSAALAEDRRVFTSNGIGDIDP